MKRILYSFALILIFSACQEDRIIYELEETELTAISANKNRQKTQTQFISVLYTDLFEKSIAPSDLNEISNQLISHGDKQAFNEMLVNKWINDQDAVIPTDAEMRAEPEIFATETYARFYGRLPTELEKYYLSERIEEDNAMTVKLVYAAFVISNEYLFY